MATTTTNRAGVTITTAAHGSAAARVYVIPARSNLVRLQTGFTTTFRTLGEISNAEAHALLDALKTALDETAERS